MSAIATFRGGISSELTEWLERQLSAGVTRIALRHKSEDGGGETLVREFSMNDGGSIPGLADIINKRAQDDGRHFRGRSIYGVFAFAEHEYVDRFFIAVDGAEDMSHFGTREANLSGVTQQLMRHNEANARLAIGQTLDVINHYRSLLQQREKRIEELEAKYWKVAELYERLTSMQHDRDLEVMRMQQSDKRQDFLKEKLDMIAPVLMSRVMPGASKGAALGEELVRQFLKSLTPDQMGAIMGALAPEQAAVINEIYVAYAEREVGKDEAKKTKRSPPAGETKS